MQNVKLINRSVGLQENLTQEIAYAARVSNPANQNNHETDERLIRYLMRNQHWSPFEMVSVCLEIRTTRDIARQILRHRSFSFQEFSQRYAEVDINQFINRAARLQDTKNRQNSIETDNNTLASEWDQLQEAVSIVVADAYSWAIDNGIAKEQARCVLPEGMTPSTMYMNGTLRSWIHYIQLRSGNGTQKEHKEIAVLCAKAIKPIFSMIMEFVDGYSEEERSREADQGKHSESNNLLNPSDSASQKPISKKEACEILNISYNTTRLAKIIQDHLDTQKFIETRKSLNKGKSATPEEIQSVVIEYLRGENISNIAAGLFRSAGFVKSIIERIGVPQRGNEDDMVNNVDYLPEQCVADSFEENELAWSARYHTLVRVGKELTIEFQESRKGMKVIDYEAKYGAKCYQIYVIENVNSEDSFFPGVQTGGYNAYALAYDLGSLRHLKALGINLDKL